MTTVEGCSGAWTLAWLALGSSSYRAGSSVAGRPWKGRKEGRRRWEG